MTGSWPPPQVCLPGQAGQFLVECLDRLYRSVGKKSPSLTRQKFDQKFDPGPRLFVFLAFQPLKVPVLAACSTKR